MQLSHSLIWHDHIESIAKKAACRLGFLRRSKQYFSSSNLSLIYKAFIRPILEYNSHIWAGASASSKNIIDSIQRRAFRIIHDESIINSYQTLEHRRSVAVLSLFYRYFHGDCSTEIFNIIPNLATFNYSTRASQTAHPFTVMVDFNRTSKMYNSFVPRTSRLWNSLPSHVFPTSYDLSKFKSNVHNFLFTNPLNISVGQRYPNV